jgi:hypothetical protein
MSIIKNPIDQYFDLDGSPLSAGYLYFGAVNGNPETSPIGVYWDNLLTIPASQPIRTVNGYPSRLGSPASIYTGQDVSITVKNKKGALVFYQPTSSLTNAAQNIITRTSNTVLTANDIGKTILATGTFTQTFDASVALGSGWSITYANVGSGVITLDPNLTELIDGISTKAIPAGRSLIIYCDGIGLTTTLFAAPFIDSTPLLKGSVDSTKQVAFEVDGLTTATTRTLTIQDKNYTAAGLDDLGKRLAQIQTFQTGVVATGTTIMPSDNTIPQSTEGDQYMSLAITPTNVNSLLEVTVQMHTSSSVQNNMVHALFQDSNVNAVAACISPIFAATASGFVTFTYTALAGSLSLTTFKVRAGGNAAGTTTFNGAGGGQLLGGVMASRITIKEYLP